jgi:hypothetical protein
MPLPSRVVGVWPGVAACIAQLMPGQVKCATHAFDDSGRCHQQGRTLTFVA